VKLWQVIETCFSRMAGHYSIIVFLPVPLWRFYRLQISRITYFLLTYRSPLDGSGKPWNC